MRLCIGLTDFSLPWQMALEQEKLYYQMLNGASLTPELFPVIIVSGSGIPQDKLKDYMQRGGVLVGDKAADFIIPEIAADPHFIKIPISIADELQDWQACHKSFAYGGFAVTELVAKRPKSHTFQRIKEALTRAFHKADLPYVHVWYYPEAYETVFGFRFDLDEYQASDFSRLCSWAKDYAESMTCCVCAASYETHPEELNRLSAFNPEIASHAYIHHVYHSYEQNLKNILEAENVLKKNQRKIEAFAGPHGKWHPALNRVLEERGYLYSSEFSLDYDGFPFYPIVKNSPSAVLQIPVHPVCEGVFLERYGHQEGMIENYFEAVIKDKAGRHQPLFFFGHAENRLGRHPQIMEKIYQIIETLPRVWKTQFSTFAKWWKKRETWRPQFEFSGNILTLTSPIRDAEAAVEILTPQGTRGVFPAELLEKGFELSRLKKEPSLQVASVRLVREEEVSQSVLKKIRLWAKDQLDWEVKTPLASLLVTSFSSLIKYGVRFVLDCVGTSRPRSY